MHKHNVLFWGLYRLWFLFFLLKKCVSEVKVEIISYLTDLYSEES